MRRSMPFVIAIVLGVLGLGGFGTSPLPISAQATPAATWQVFASGLNNPRGLLFAPDGSLYVAEGGTGGTKRTTSRDCQQVPVPDGPYLGGITARISKISLDGTRSTVIDGLPSTQTSIRSGGDVSGVSSLAFIDTTLYAVTAGAGCSHGNLNTVNAMLKISDDGKATQVADISTFLAANPVKTIDAADFEPDGDIYSMIAVNAKLYIIESNHGELDEIATDGTIKRIIDISAQEGHIVPTALAYKDSSFYVSNLSTLPVHTGAARLYKITPDGDITELAPHLSAVLGLAFDAQGTLYALETSTLDKKYPTAGSGTVVRIDPASATAEVVASGLTFPTALAFGPDGMLYVSNFGYGAKPGKGQIVRMAIPAQN